MQVISWAVRDRLADTLGRRILRDEISDDIFGLISYLILIPDEMHNTSPIWGLTGPQREAFKYNIQSQTRRKHHDILQRCLVRVSGGCFLIPFISSHSRFLWLLFTFVYQEQPISIQLHITHRRARCTRKIVSPAGDFGEYFFPHERTPERNRDA